MDLLFIWKNVYFDYLPIFNRIVCFLLLSFMCPLYILGVKPIAHEGIINKLNFI